MGRCQFCEAAAVQRVWARRWRVREGRRVPGSVSDVRLRLCEQHLRRRLFHRSVVVVGEWAYG